VLIRARRHWKGAVLGGAGLLVALVVGGPYVYIHAFEGSQPAPLALSDVPMSTAPASDHSSSGTPSSRPGSLDGVWRVTEGSQAGYRVNETLAGQSTTAVGRTSAVTGSITISAKAVTAASFTVQMASVTSDRDQRDQQFSGRIMDTAQYPTGTFVLTMPIVLGKAPKIGKVITVQATGTLTLHGTTRPVTFSVSAKRTNDQIAATGEIPITYGDYNIDNPSFGGFVSVGSSGTVEFLLVLTKS
jgi:polyisoprenoid-binding protein YceI